MNEEQQERIPEPDSTESTVVESKAVESTRDETGVKTSEVIPEINFIPIEKLPEDLQILEVYGERLPIGTMIPVSVTDQFTCTWTGGGPLEQSPTKLGLDVIADERGYLYVIIKGRPTRIKKLHVDAGGLAELIRLNKEKAENSKDDKADVA